MSIATRRQKGFTIVELLIVVVVIGILAAISIVSYSGITQRATEAVLKSDLKSGQQQLEVYALEQGDYPSSLPSAIQSQTMTTDFTYTKSSTGFCLQATAAQNDAVAFYITESGVIQSGACEVAPVATSELCFSISSGVVQTYYDHENNDSNQPACPRDVVIPSSISGQTVTSFATNAMSYKNLTSVIIPSTVTSIGTYAFSSNSISSVTIPEGVTIIYDRAFMSNNLTTVTIPEGVATIADSAFNNNQLTSVTIPSSVSYIGDGAFINNALTTVSVPNSATVSSNAFDSGVTVTQY